MDTCIPSAQDVRAALDGLTLKQLGALAKLSGVPVTTIYKIKRNETKNPGVETLRLFMPHIKAAHLLGADGFVPSTPTAEAAT